VKETAGAICRATGMATGRNDAAKARPESARTDLESMFGAAEKVAAGGLTSEVAIDAQVVFCMAGI